MSEVQTQTVDLRADGKPQVVRCNWATRWEIISPAGVKVEMIVPANGELEITIPEGGPCDLTFNMHNEERFAPKGPTVVKD
jgi:hypothetical protein